MNRQLQESFRAIYKNPEHLNSYRSYYNSLRNWVIDNKKTIGEKQIDPMLNILLSLQLDDYNLEEIQGNGLYPTEDSKRLAKRDYEKLDYLLLSIRDTLWDLVTISSDDNCPCCNYGDLRYLKINNKSLNRKIILECQSCGQAFNIDGSKFSETIEDYLPASKKDVESLT